MGANIEEIDAAYNRGYSDALKQMRTRFRRELADISRWRAEMRDLLRDPDSLVRRAKRNPEVGNAILAATVVLMFDETPSG